MVNSTTLGSATVLEPEGIQTLDVGSAMKQVVAPLLKSRISAGSAYGVLVYGQDYGKPQPNVLVAVQTFLKAYQVAWKALEHIPDFVGHGKGVNFELFEAKRFEQVRFFFGRATERDLKERVQAFPGVYIMTAHLDPSLLKSLNLPQLPPRFRDLPLVMLVENATEPATSVSVSAHAGIEELVTPQEEKVENAIARDTLEWRQEFMRNYPSWTSAEVATQSTSTARNRAAIASRWQRENRIFGLRYQAQQYFPQFQFQDGTPVPIVGEVIKTFPEHATGWDLAFFFTTPNANIGGRKPLELIKTNPDRVLSLAHAFAHPADVF